MEYLVECRTIDKVRSCERSRDLSKNKRGKYKKLDFEAILVRVISLLL